MPTKLRINRKDPRTERLLDLYRDGEMSRDQVAVALRVVPSAISNHMNRRRTPRVPRKDLATFMDKEFHFCADLYTITSARLLPNAKIRMAPGDALLDLDWGTGPCWLCPPFYRNIDKYVNTAVGRARRGLTVVMVVPSLTNATWWSSILQASELRFVPKDYEVAFFSKRKKLGKHRGPMTVAIFRPGHVGFPINKSFYANKPLDNSTQLT